MTPDRVPADGFARSAGRAEALAGAAEGGAARPLLLFAASLLRLQARVAKAIGAGHALESLSGSLPADLARLAEPYAAFLESLRSSPAGEVADEAGRRLERADDGRDLLLAAWHGPVEGVAGFVSRGFLRPYLATLLEARVHPDRHVPDGSCPFCGGLSAVGFLRGGPEGDGAGRHLVCASCGDERPEARVRCPACSEDDPGRLAVFRAETHPAVRIEACDTCRRYVKTIDLTLDARPIPEVDDLVSVSMDLWVQEQGYRRLAPGLGGI